jgi:hypothetical protein
MIYDSDSEVIALIVAEPDGQKLTFVGFHGEPGLVGIWD